MSEELINSIDGKLMESVTDAINVTGDSNGTLWARIPSGLYRKKAVSGYPEICLPKSSYSSALPKQSYSIISYYQRGNQLTTHRITFNQAGNYTISLTYSTGWICYLEVQFCHNGSVSTLLTTSNTGTSGTKSYTWDCSAGDYFNLLQHTDSENASNRYVNCSYTVTKNS